MTITSLPSAPLVTDPPSTFNTKAFAMVGALPTLVTEINAAIALNDITAAADIHALALKATPVDADELPLLDSAATFALKRLTWANLKATLETWLNSLTATWSNKTLVAPALGTPSALVGTNITGTAASLTAGNVTTNANLTGHVTSTGNAAVLGSFTLAQLNTAVSDANIARTDAANTFTGVQTMTSPAITTPAITGAATGTGVATAATANTLVMRGATGEITGGATTVTTLTASGGITASGGASAVNATGSGNPDCRATSTSGIITILAAVDAFSGGYVGTSTNHELGIYANNNKAITVATTGAVTIPGTQTVTGVLTATGGIAVEAVIAPTLTNSWVNNGAASTAAGYWKDAFGMVHLRGQINSGSAGAAAFTLPAGYRPAKDHLFDGLGPLVAVYATGVVSPSASSLTSLDGISFRV